MLTRDQIVQSFHDAHSPRDSWLIGGEFERHLIRADGQPAPYFGEHGVAWLLDEVAKRGASIGVPFDKRSFPHPYFSSQLAKRFLAARLRSSMPGSSTMNQSAK